MSIVRTNKMRAGGLPKGTLAPTWIAVSESQPNLNGLLFAKQLPARAACFQRDVVEVNHFRFEVAPGDICVSVDGASPAVERCEIASIKTMLLETAYTIRYSMKIATPGLKDAASDGWILMGQLHQTPDAGDAGVSPLFAREIYNPVRAISYNQRTSLVDPIVSTPTSNYFYIDSDPTPQWNRWIAVVEEHFISPNTTNGYHRIYHDGVLVASYSGKTGYVDAVGPYWKFGIYRDVDGTNTNIVELKDWSCLPLLS